ncbi:hypothetical protein L7F22_012005 [Adiantum nelumboides]|nr:hypothetical protein [Adiantum nelumboides]
MSFGIHIAPSFDALAPPLEPPPTPTPKTSLRSLKRLLRATGPTLSLSLLEAEIMGVLLTNPTVVSSINVPQVDEGKLAKMLAKDLTQEERQAYLAMLEGYTKLFIDGYDQITGVSVVQHHINLKDRAKPVVQRLRRLGVIQQDALLLSEVRKLLNAGSIYPVEDSEWVSPIVVTPKKNGKWRVCVDYKSLNAATKRDHFPLPFQDEILNEAAGYERYTMCDGYSGYFQIRIAEEDQKKTPFVTPWGCFAYRVMPFGLTNAPATFQRFVTHVFQPFFGKSIRVFIDDFCIYSLRVLHLEKVNEGLARLQSLGGQLNVDKCHIAESQVTVLGHVVSSRGIEADPGKVQALVSLPSPKSARELVSFIQKVIFHPTKSASNWWYVIKVAPCSAQMYEGYHVPITTASVEKIKEEIAETKAGEVVQDEPGIATRYGMHAEDLQNEMKDICLNKELYIDIGSYAELYEDERKIS